MLSLIGMWYDIHYEKIWLITMIAAIILFVFAIITRSELIYDMSEDITDFYDEILSE